MFEQYLYASGLLLTIACLLMVDYRWKLAIFNNRNRALKTVGFGVALFAVWDVLGIRAHIFYTGSASVITRIFLISQFPLEELFFLVVLVYTTLLFWRSLERWV